MRRLDAVEELYNDNGLRNRLKEHLQPIYDLERITSRIAYGTANAKDLLALKNSLLLFPDVASDLALLKTEAFTELAAQFDVLDDVCAELSQSINEEAPFWYNPKCRKASPPFHCRAKISIIPDCA